MLYTKVIFFLNVFSTLSMTGIAWPLLSAPMLLAGLLAAALGLVLAAGGTRSAP